MDESGFAFFFLQLVLAVPISSDTVSANSVFPILPSYKVPGSHPAQSMSSVAPNKAFPPLVSITWEVLVSSLSHQFRLFLNSAKPWQIDSIADGVGRLTGRSLTWENL